MLALLQLLFHSLLVWATSSFRPSHFCHPAMFWSCLDTCRSMLSPQTTHCPCP